MIGKALVKFKTPRGPGVRQQKRVGKKGKKWREEQGERKVHERRMKRPEE